MRVVVLAFLLLVSTPAAAEWVRYGEYDRGVVYYDPATIKKHGDIRRVWQLEDNKQRSKSGAMSSRRLLDFRCMEELIRIHYESSHSEPMGRGNDIRINNQLSDWSHVPPDSPAAALLKIVCR